MLLRELKSEMRKIRATHDVEPARLLVQGAIESVYAAAAIDSAKQAVIRYDGEQWAFAYLR